MAAGPTKAGVMKEFALQSTLRNRRWVVISGI